MGRCLKDSTPYDANEKLVSMANAIVRNCIANSTIDAIITNRQLIRKALKAEMFDVVKGWGVWVETIEITDVKILSGSLFKNLQSKFREEQNQKAELERMEIEHELNLERLKSDLEMSNKRCDNKNSQSIYNKKKTLEKNKEDAKLYKSGKELEKVNFSNQRENITIVHTRNVEKEIVIEKENILFKEKDLQNRLANLEANQQYNEAYYAKKLVEAQEQNEAQRKKDDFALAEERKKWDAKAQSLAVDG